MGSNGGVASGANFKVQSSSQTNFFVAPNDATSNFSHQIAGTTSQQNTKHQHITLSNDEQVSHDGTSEPGSSSLPPLKCYTSNGQTTPIMNPAHIMNP